MLPEDLFPSVLGILWNVRWLSDRCFDAPYLSYGASTQVGRGMLLCILRESCSSVWCYWPIQLFYTLRSLVLLVSGTFIDIHGWSEPHTQKQHIQTWGIDTDIHISVERNPCITRSFSTEWIYTIVKICHPINAQTSGLKSQSDIEPS